MSRPQEDILHLPKSPLIFVLAQIRISPVMKMEEKIPDMQEAFRKNGFPRLIKRDIETTKGQPNQGVIVENNTQWEFISKNKKASVLVDQNFMIYQVSEYDVFESFLGEFREAAKIFGEYTEPNLVEKLGLRYIDLVIPEDGKNPASYFCDDLRGFTIGSTGNRDSFLCESVSHYGSKMKLIHRYIEAQKGIAFPSNLMPITLDLKKEVSMNSEFAVLDMDAISDYEDDFSVEVLTKTLWELHGIQEEAFKASVTAEALKEWSQSNGN